MPIQRSGDVYTFTDNIYGTIKIQKSNIVLDGAGYTLSGPYNGSQANVWVVGNGPNQSPDLVAEYIIGVDLGAKTVEGITIQNLNIKNFSIGMYMWTKNNTVTGNCGVREHLGHNAFRFKQHHHKQLPRRTTSRAYFSVSTDQKTAKPYPADIVVYHNGFEDNDVQMNGCFCEDYPEGEEAARMG